MNGVCADGSCARTRKFRRARVAVAALTLCGSSAWALEFAPGDGDLKIRWDNNLKYSAAARVHGASDVLLGNPNQDDGDRNFRRGLISNRIDLLSDLDVVYKGDFGVRVSGAAWYDSVYNRGTSNESAATFNPASVSVGQFTDATRGLHGRKAEWLDAFVFAKGVADGMRWNVRAGQHTVLWGETLFFGGNGIAGAQSPVDVVKIQSVPNWQFKEIIRPVGQFSGSLQITQDVQLSAYYQYEWQATRLPGVGSYFATQDVFDVGGERFLVPFPPFKLRRGADLGPKDSGQGGLQMRFRLPQGQTDYGLYAVRFHDKTPQLYLSPLLGSYQIAYQQGITSFGASANRTFGDVNLAAEVSIRRNAALANDGAVNFSLAQTSIDTPLHPVGKTAHLNLSMIWTVPRTPLFNEATLLAEVGWNRALSVSNGLPVAANSSRDAWGLRTQFVPSYRQVLPGLDLEVPIGLGYNPEGRSQAVSFFNGGVNQGGDVSVGLSGNYLNTWKFGLSYTHYLGSAGTVTTAQGQLTFKQALRDRDFLSFNVQTTF